LPLDPETYLRLYIIQLLMVTEITRKLAYYGHTMKKQMSCLEKEIMQGTMLGAPR